jgi:HSP20 family molecular chaperone IbpA
MTTVSIRTASTILDEIEKVYDDITRKAYERFLERRDTYTLDIEDWLAAEKQVLWKPDVQITEKQGLFIVRVALGPVDPATVDVLVTSDDVLVQTNDSSRPPRVFRAIHFPSPINPLQLYGTYLKGTLMLIAPKIAIRNAIELSIIGHAKTSAFSER